MALFNELIDLVAIWKLEKIVPLTEMCSREGVSLDPETLVIKGKYGLHLKITGTSKPKAKIEKEIIIDPKVTCAVDESFPLDKILVEEFHKGVYNENKEWIPTGLVIYRALIIE